MRSVVICGSRKFKPGIRDFAAKLKQRGVVVFEPHLHESEKSKWDALSEEYKDFILLGLTFDHFQKIRLADVVFIYNLRGYIGVNTTLEIGVAAALAKSIYSLEPDQKERGRNVLFQPVHPSTPEELIPFL